MQIRHIIIHNNGRPDDKFKSAFVNFIRANSGMNKDEVSSEYMKFLNKNGKIPINYEMVCKAISCYKITVKELDQQLLKTYPFLTKMGDKKTPTKAGV